MSAEATPAPAHEPPSLPASPLPKRTKFVEASTASVASILNDNAPTPTPQNNPIEALTTDPTSTNLPSLNTMDPPPPPLQVKLLSETAKVPTRGSAHAAGYDLYAAKATKIPARGKAMIDTDISIAVPAGTYGRVAPRSGLASKHSIDTGAGVIDADYRGPVKVLLFNFGENEFSVEAGDRVAQLIVERIYTPEIVVVEQLDETVRGAGGFGSTGGFGGTLPGINGVTGAVPSPATLPGA